MRGWIYGNPCPQKFPLAQKLLYFHMIYTVIYAKIRKEKWWRKWKWTYTHQLTLSSQEFQATTKHPPSHTHQDVSSHPSPLLNPYPYIASKGFHISLLHASPIMSRISASYHYYPHGIMLLPYFLSFYDPCLIVACTKVSIYIDLISFPYIVFTFYDACIFWLVGHSPVDWVEHHLVLHYHPYIPF